VSVFEAFGLAFFPRGHRLEVEDAGLFADLLGRGFDPAVKRGRAFGAGQVEVVVRHDDRWRVGGRGDARRGNGERQEGSGKQGEDTHRKVSLDKFWPPLLSSPVMSLKPMCTAPFGFANAKTASGVA